MDEGISEARQAEGEQEPWEEVVCKAGEDNTDIKTKPIYKKRIEFKKQIKTRWLKVLKFRQQGKERDGLL